MPDVFIPAMGSKNIPNIPIEQRIECKQNVNRIERRLKRVLNDDVKFDGCYLRNKIIKRTYGHNTTQCNTL